MKTFSHDDDSLSENCTLASNRPQKRRVHSVHCRRENRLLQRPHEGWRRGVSDLETAEKSVWSAKRTETEILRKCGFVANMLDTCLWTHPAKRVSLVYHVDDLMLAGTQKNISEVLAELRRDLEIKSNEVTAKPSRYLGRTLVKTEEVYNFGVDASYVENMLEEFNMTALKMLKNTEMGTP